MFNVNKMHLLSFRVILLGFLLVILAGAGLLALPWAAADEQRVVLIQHPDFNVTHLNTSGRFFVRV